jgi:hypothetical protein
MNSTSQSPSGRNTDDVTIPPAEAVPPRSPSPRPLFAIAFIAAVMGLGITLSFGYADHDPSPHEVRVSVVAAPAVVAQVAAGLQRAEPGGFDVMGAPSARAAVQAVRSQGGSCDAGSRRRTSIVSFPPGSSLGPRQRPRGRGLKRCYGLRRRGGRCALDRFTD